MKQTSSNPTRRFWSTVSDEQLVNLDLEIDNPQTLPGMVQEVPADFKDAHVEFKYDLRGQEVEEFSCVHGHHKHKAGFVMKLGDLRFMVGHICAKSIYNEDFDQYVADIDAAIIRRDALRRVRELKDAVAPFSAWLAEVGQSDIFKHWSKLRGQIDSHMMWIFDSLTAIAHLDPRITGAPLPKTLCSAGAAPREAFDQVIAEVAKITGLISQEPERAAGIIGALRSRMEKAASRVETILQQLQEIELFFQPSTLAVICKYANAEDNPRRRTYSSGLLSITVKNDKGYKTHILMPKGFAMPSRRPIEAFRAAVSGVKSEPIRKARAG
ncbi:hypothetical protein [Tardiphaga sp. 841_E9_N1_2]|uniref:hypothetical protein n=1 Tax=Tardiphaga sp. 841_E9_N1_2 TaxID=3240762 RepID=UPI003F1FDD13